VERAFAKITWGKRFTEEQRRWLELIKAHLVENLAVDERDLDQIPAFSRRGGRRAAEKVFGHKLGELLREINREVAAA